ncbi:DUF485 domain-containing protein [Streptomyces sp. ME01-24h]|nr:DUF485 domain-containing protein [Streptomyces sp. ME19-03-3]MDX3352277.1 DUF485 domain-containing protein [Streptomyces sp. ME01-24h]
MEEHDQAETGGLRVNDPWYDVLAAGEWEGPEPPPVCLPPQARGADDHAGVYREVQAGSPFQEVRSRYRRFAFPAAAAFLAWYLLYVVLATTAPRMMARSLVGELNVAMALGLAQFASTFLLTWAYARHARLHRDRAALDLRWDTQERMR